MATRCTFPNCVRITRWKLPCRTCDARTEGWNLNGERRRREMGRISPFRIYRNRRRDFSWFLGTWSILSHFHSSLLVSEIFLFLSKRASIDVRIDVAEGKEQIRGRYSSSCFSLIIRNFYGKRGTHHRNRSGRLRPRPLLWSCPRLKHTRKFSLHLPFDRRVKQAENDYAVLSIFWLQHYLFILVYTPEIFRFTRVYISTCWHW